MINVLFICHGNICRSPMAEFLFKDLVKKEGLEKHFHIESAATSQEEIGNGVYPPVKQILSSLNIDCSEKTARQVTAQDFESYDYLIVMDENNMRNMHYLFPKGDFSKVAKLKDYCVQKGDIADPWYTGNFALTQKEITQGTRDFLDFIKYQSGRIYGITECTC